MVDLETSWVSYFRHPPCMRCPQPLFPLNICQCHGWTPGRGLRSSPDCTLTSTIPDAARGHHARHPFGRGARPLRRRSTNEGVARVFHYVDDFSLVDESIDPFDDMIFASFLVPMSSGGTRGHRAGDTGAHAANPAAPAPESHATTRRALGAPCGMRRNKRNLRRNLIYV